MRERTGNGAKLFLLELMLSIFFFAVIAAVCVQLFSEAHAKSVHSEELVEAVNAVANCAEYYTVWDGQETSWQEVFPEGEWQNDTWSSYVDDEGQATTQEGTYALRMELADEGELCVASICFVEVSSERIVYELEVKRPAWN